MRFDVSLKNLCSTDDDVKSSQHWPSLTPWFTPSGLNLVVLFRDQDLNILFLQHSLHACGGLNVCLTESPKRVFVWLVQH